MIFRETDVSETSETLSRGQHTKEAEIDTPIGDATYPVISEPDTTPDNGKTHGLARVLKSGAVYFLLTVGAEFVLEVIRLQVVALHVSERFADMLEIPNVLLATIIGARWVVDRFMLPPLPGIRLSVGLVALALLLITEGAVMLPFHGFSVAEYLASHDSLVGVAPLGALGVLTVMPFLVGYRWER